MGLELITQPQVFLAPITAFGGIQNGPFGDPVPPLFTSFFSWTSTSSTSASVFPLDGVEILTNRSGSFIVTVGGVIQSPTSYTVDPITRNLTFDFTVNPDTPVLVTQIGTVAASSSLLTDLTTVNLYAENSLLRDVTATNITILSSTFALDTRFNRVTASDFVALTSTLLNFQSVFVPTSSFSLTAVDALFLGSVSAISGANITNNVTVIGDISATGVVYASGGDSNLWNYNTTLLESNSANWQSTYEAVCALSASWEESADILPIVTNYLSTSNVQISGLTVEDLTVVSSNVFQVPTLVNLVSALAVTVNGDIVYLPLLSAV